MDKKCPICKRIFWCKPSHFARRKACSRKCFYESRRKEKTKHVCRNCGCVFYKDASRGKYGRGVYCSRKCQYEAARNKPKKRAKRVCVGCGAVFFVWPSRLKSKAGRGKYCSRKCRDDHRVGLLHPQFLGGENSKNRGSNWQSQKRKALKRDGRVCQVCGKKGTDVHHRIPKRRFADKNEANNLENLITLCKKHHRKEDAKVQKKERESHG